MVSSGTDVDVTQPRARRPNGAINAPNDVQEPQLLRADGNGESLGEGDLPPLSRAPTPIPSDAPPSIQATSTARKQIRAERRKRLFPTVEYAARVSHLDPRSEHHDFSGFFVLFWIGLAIMCLTTMVRNVRETGFPFALRQKDVFLANIWELAASDFLLVLSTGIDLPLHMLFRRSKGFFRWNSAGIWIQSIFQAAWLFYWVNWPFVRNWTWTAQVFFTLHLLALFMKLHSWAFYNGHLSECRRQLDELDKPHEAEKRPKRRPLVRYPSSTAPLEKINMQLRQDAKSDPVKAASQHREDLAWEVTSPLGNVSYPNNLTVPNFVDYICCPTLCYELEYPRTESFQPMELFLKVLAIFGCIFLLTITSEEFIIPVLEEAAEPLQQSQTLIEGALIMAETISRLLFPFMVAFLLVFLVIFEYILGALAEITCFADRGSFYEDWWNCSSFLEFSRHWNIPVHNFFKRHVYSASRGRLSRPMATVITFLISALAHELLMGCITKKLRGYGAIAMMLQMPLVVIQRSKYFRGRTLLNNVLFWISMILGLAMLCALYVLL